MLLWFKIVARGDNMDKLIHYEEIDQNDCIGGAIFNLMQQD